MARQREDNSNAAIRNSQLNTNIKPSSFLLSVLYFCVLESLLPLLRYSDLLVGCDVEYITDRNVRVILSLCRAVS